MWFYLVVLTRYQLTFHSKNSGLCVSMALDDSIKKRIFTGGMLGICLALIVVVSSVFISNYFSNPFIPTSSETEDLFYTIPQSVKTSFSTYIPYETFLDFTPSLTPFTIAADLNNVKNYNPSNPVFQALTEEAKALLVKNGFVVVPSDYSQIYDIYIDNENVGVPNFVTTDAVLHAYHILYDNVLRCVEGDRFESMLLSLTELMVNASRTQFYSLASPPIKEAARKNLAFFSVGNYLLNSTVEIDPSVNDLVNAELQLINSHSAIHLSPIFGYFEDYSQYKPRGHYTRTEGLSRFFKAMMWYGRISFRLQPSDGKGINETRQAILISLAMIQSEEILELWQGIYEPTVFFVGSADDLIYSDYWEIIRDLFHQPIDPELFGNDSLVEQIITKGLEYRNPRIFSSIVFTWENASLVTKGLRFMGQRFIPDSYIFQSLVHDNVFMRCLPKSLDIFAVLGSNRSKELLGTEADLYPDYLPEREKLELEFSEYNASTWTQNLYWLWLYSLMPLLYPKGSGFPVYMQTPAWIDKELFTALGSWTELRHDTILYAKQSYTKTISLPPEPEQGYVEPNPILYARFASLTLMTFDGLKSRALLPTLIEDRLNTLHDLLLSLIDISQKELEDQTLNESEINVIKRIGGILKTIVNINESEYNTDVDKRMAIVADVHTDPFFTNQILEEGVGNPFLVFVVNNVNGELILSRGGTFSYYEFTYPLSNRLTDEEWQNILDIGINVPDLPDWVSSFIAINSFIPQIPVLATEEISYISRKNYKFPYSF